jgi:hypothetical protein
MYSASDYHELPINSAGQIKCKAKRATSDCRNCAASGRSWTWTAASWKATSNGVDLNAEAVEICAQPVDQDRTIDPARRLAAEALELERRLRRPSLPD